jgi:Sulfotransferase domain
MKNLIKYLLPDRYKKNESTNEKDLFLGIHIHKTAGMTLLGQVKEQLGKDQYYINSMYAVNFKENSNELEERTDEQLKKIRFVFGHDINEYMITFFKDRNIKLFTFLREPIDRIVSWYCFYRKLHNLLGQNVGDFNHFYNVFFPRHSICSMITNSFPSLIDNQEDPLYLQAISVLRKFYFIATVDDFSIKTPILFKQMGIHFEGKMTRNSTNYEKEMDFESQIDFDFLREDNKDDIKLYNTVVKMNNSGNLNYVGFDHDGYERGLSTIYSKTVPPFVTLLKSYLGPIKNNYKLEKIYDDTLACYEKELSNIVIKLYALEDNEEKKRQYKELLIELNNKFSLGLSSYLA